MMNQKTRLQFALLNFTVLCVSTIGMAQSSDQNGQGIEVYTENAFYWQFDGTPTLLLGASSNDNLFQNPQVEQEINLLHSLGACRRISIKPSPAPQKQYESQDYSGKQWYIVT